MTLKSIYVLILIFISALLGLFFIFSQEKKIAVGFIADFSGQSNNMGVHSRNGAQMAIDDINSRGGLWGRSLELIVRDNRGDPGKSKSIIQDFISDEVPLVIGPHLSRSALVLMEESEGRDILIISPVVSTDSAVGIDDNFFRMNTSASDDGKTLASAVSGRGDANVAILWSRANREYTSFIAEGVKSELEKNEVNIVYEKEFSDKEDFTEIVDSLLKLNLDGIIFSSISRDSALIVQLYARKADLPHLYGCQWTMSTDIPSSGGKTVEGMILVGEYLNSVPIQREKQFRSDYAALYGTDPNFSSIYAFESIKVFEKAVKGVGSDWTPEKIREEILRIRTFDGLADTFEIDQFGDAQRRKSLYIIENNKYELYSEN